MTRHHRSRATMPSREGLGTGPSHGDKDFGGHDAEAEGAAEAGMGPKTGDRPEQAGTDEPEIGENPVPGR